jgi:hypothetical protein
MVIIRAMQGIKIYIPLLLPLTMPALWSMRTDVGSALETRCCIRLQYRVESTPERVWLYHQIIRYLCASQLMV